MPQEILVIDGSYDEVTTNVLRSKTNPRLKYFKVGKEARGLTRQRNFGIEKTGEDIDIICFLDDDTILDKNYFQNLINTYLHFPKAIGVGGYIVDEVGWVKNKKDPSYDDFQIDGWCRKLGRRNFLRKKFGLLSNKPPGFMPVFSHGLSTGFLPPSGKTYPVEFFMGGVASYKRNMLRSLRFSKYFEGYGLYEDLDFCLRASRKGQLYVNTGAQVLHYHEKSGRPKSYKYGMMVVRNGWYVWRVKYPNPSLKSTMKWIAVSILLLLIRCGNLLTAKDKKNVFFECVGRLGGLISLFLQKPQPE